MTTQPESQTARKPPIEVIPVPETTAEPFPLISKLLKLLKRK